MRWLRLDNVWSLSMVDRILGGFACGEVLDIGFGGRLVEVPEEPK